MEATRRIKGGSVNQCMLRLKTCGNGKWVKTKLQLGRDEVCRMAATGGCFGYGWATSEFRGNAEGMVDMYCRTPTQIRFMKGLLFHKPLVFGWLEADMSYWDVGGLVRICLWSLRSAGRRLLHVGKTIRRTNEIAQRNSASPLQNSVPVNSLRNCSLEWELNLLKLKLCQALD